MNGILEQLIAALQANTAAILAGGGAPVQQAPPQLQQQAQTQVPPQTTTGGAAITADAITALIQPHIANDTIKGALGAAMRAMGINALPETQPHQFAALYQAFQNVIAQHTGGGALAGSSASII